MVMAFGGRPKRRCLLASPVPNRATIGLTLPFGVCPVPDNRKPHGILSARGGEIHGIGIRYRLRWTAPR
jgi:hypothetical protein